MPTARRRIAIIITALLIGSIPAMAPAVIIFRGENPGLAAGIGALASLWLVLSAVTWILIPTFTDRRLPMRACLRACGLGLVLGVITGVVPGLVIMPTVGALIGAILGTWLAERELGRAFGAITQGTRDDARAVRAAIGGVIARLTGSAPSSRPDPAPSVRVESAPVVTAEETPSVAEVAPLGVIDEAAGRRRGDG